MNQTFPVRRGTICKAFTYIINFLFLVALVNKDTYFRGKKKIEKILLKKYCKMPIHRVLKVVSEIYGGSREGQNKQKLIKNECIVEHF